MTLDFTEREWRLINASILIREAALRHIMPAPTLVQYRQQHEQEANDLRAIADKIAGALRQEDPT